MKSMPRRAARRLSWGTAVALVIVAIPAGGDAPVPDTTPLSIEAAVRDAVAWHPAITQAGATLDARGQDIAVARAGYLPRIGAGVGTGYDSRLAGGWRPRPQVSASQMLFDFGKVASAVDAARAGTAIGRADLLLAVDGLARDTGYAIVEMQRNAALHTIAAEQLARIRDIGDLVADRFAKGATTRSDALQAQSRIAAAQATVAQIEAEQRRWASNLAYLLGRAAPPTAIDADMPDWLMRSCTRPLPDWTAVPAVMRAAAQKDQATAELRRSRADRLPTVALAGDATTDVTGPFTNRSAYGFGLNVSTSVFGGNAVRARVRGASFALDAAEAAARQTRNETAQRLAEAQQQIDSLRELLATATARQENMVETGKLYRLQYLDMGTRTLVDLLNAEQELQLARFDAANTVHDLRRLEIDCLYYSGRTRDGFGLTGTRVRGVVL